LDYRFMPHRIAGSGTMGLGDTKDGSKGGDLILPVPPGTIVFEAKGAVGEQKQPGAQLADLSHPGDRFVAAAGGMGGLGNAALASKTRRAPGFALLGEPGEERDVILELKSIADVALVGFPSSGKSSLVAAMSSAKPKIADYPFTTLVPNLGVVMADEYRFTVADVPGLIPGASQGKGLGLEFLRHIERTEIIAHVIDCATLEPDRDPVADYHALEHELAQYASQLKLPLGAIPIPERPRIIVLNKVDVPEAHELADFVRPEFEKLGLRVFEVSTASHEGLQQLAYALGEMVTECKAQIAERARDEEAARVVIKPLEQPQRRRRSDDEGGSGHDFSIERRERRSGEPWFIVTGAKPERWVLQTNFDNDEAVGYLADRLAKLGVEKALRSHGARPGDTVRIGKGDRAVEFEWDPTIAAGAEMLDGAQLGARGKDLRLGDPEGRTRRRTNEERRREYHEMMDAKAAVREAMKEEREVGHWADPGVDDDRHDTQAKIGRSSQE
ncbi:GTPase ObgE, partial [Bifidobacterium mongoliense]